MKIQTIVLDDDVDDLQRLKTLFCGKSNITYVQDVKSAIEAISGDATIIVTDYFLEFPDTGLTFMQKVIDMGVIAHFIFVSSKPTLDIALGISKMRWAFSFKDKNNRDFEEWMLIELKEVEEVLMLKTALVLKMEQEKKVRERREKELLEEAKKVLKILESND